MSSAGPHAVRAVLLSLPPAAAAFLGNGDLLVSTALVSIAAIIIDGFRQKKRWLPFPIYLLLVYALQTSTYLLLPYTVDGNVPGVQIVDGAGGGGGGGGGGDADDRGLRGSSPQGPEIKTISVVIAAHNEHKYMERTLNSIIQETPASVLKEIIVVDDGSEPPLAPVLQAFPQVRILRHDVRRGLIKSKTEGGNMAVGDAIMFLDGHVKPEPNWAVPILRHMNINYKRVVVPLIPVLDADTWQPNFNAVGTKMMFDWTLFFQWFEDGNDLVPCMSGGLFGITRQWWHESGEYDYGMNMWGGENVEQSIRVWLCGGEVYVARDSKISHVFRHAFPYKINNTEIYINKVRTVEVWFDEFKEKFYEADPSSRQFQRFVGDIQDRLKLKQALHCKPFKWYMEKFKKVFADKHMLPEDTFLIRDRSTGLCVVSNTDGDGLVEAPCVLQGTSQRWTLANQGSGLRNVRADKCLDANAGAGKDKSGSKALLYTCYGKNPMQAWSVTNGQVRWESFCVQGASEGPLKLEKCGNFLQGKGAFEKYDLQASSM